MNRRTRLHLPTQPIRDGKRHRSTLLHRRRTRRHLQVNTRNSRIPSPKNIIPSLHLRPTPGETQASSGRNLPIVQEAPILWTGIARDGQDVEIGQIAVEAEGVVEPRVWGFGGGVQGGEGGVEWVRVGRAVAASVAEMSVAGVGLNGGQVTWTGCDGALEDGGAGTFDAEIGG